MGMPSKLKMYCPHCKKVTEHRIKPDVPPGLIRGICAVFSLGVSESCVDYYARCTNCYHEHKIS